VSWTKLVDAALSGAGVVYLHDYVVEYHVDSGALVNVLADFKTPGRSIYALYPSACSVANDMRIH
jgi:DNA-binding transcriptional LysR family regulator